MKCLPGELPWAQVHGQLDQVKERSTCEGEAVVATLNKPHDQGCLALVISEGFILSFNFDIDSKLHHLLDGLARID
ncbi:MAG: hypothetical protein CMO44_19205 [Verrucomicrobiales bacterium]|nr:hypothetical protein [Verrucomicrobiales bacterium]